MENKTCKTCRDNDDGLCDRKGILIEDDNTAGNKNNCAGTHYCVCNPCRMRSCKEKRYCSYNRVVHALDHMRNRTEVTLCTKIQLRKKFFRNV